MKKIWHPYTAWEDYKDGMWRIIPKEEKESLLSQAIEFTGDHHLYGEWMMRVVETWTIACEHNLTERASNRQAWVGHAAASMAKKLPEYITRQAWGLLTEEQRVLANLEADKAIEHWERSYARKNP